MPQDQDHLGLRPRVLGINRGQPQHFPSFQLWLIDVETPHRLAVRDLLERFAADEVVERRRQLERYGYLSQGATEDPITGISSLLKPSDGLEPSTPS
jgi:hypothetical protein